jgi:hypothetical protein
VPLQHRARVARDPSTPHGAKERRAPVGMTMNA